MGKEKPRPSRRPSKQASAFDELETEDALLDWVVGFYHQALVDDTDARAGLERVGLGSTGVLEHFRLGIANRTLGLALPLGNRKAGAAVRGRLQKLGVLRESGHEHLNGCLVVPLFDLDGRVVALHGYRLQHLARASAKDVVCAGGTDDGVVNPSAFAGKRVVVTGGVFEAMRRWPEGHPDVTAVHGPEARLDALEAALRRARTETVVLASPPEAEFEALASRIEALCRELGVGFERAGLDGLTPSRTPAPSQQPAPTPTPKPTPKPAPAEQTPAPDDELVLVFEDRRWRIRGLAANKARGTLRANVLVTREGAGLHLDVFDVCSARHRAGFVNAAAQELAVDELLVRRDMGKVLLALESAQDELLRRAHEPRSTTPTMTDAQRATAMQLLEDPRLLDRVLEDLAHLGVVGERDNLLLAYLAAVSRILPQPLAVMVQSSAAAGKSSLVNAVLSLVPDEDRVVYSSMTGQSLYYMGSTDLRHKVLCVAENRGIDRATYALKILQSEGSLTIASTGKDTGTGRLVSQEYTVRGPISVMMTTTSVDLDEELLSRCLVLTVDESPDQTRRIHARQLRAQTLTGLRERVDRAATLRRHHDAQRLLRRIHVINPHIDALASRDLRVRARRDFRKLLGVVETIAVLHQHQRELVNVEVGNESVQAVQVEPGDIELAKRLVAPTLAGPHELPGHTRQVLHMLDSYVAAEAIRLGVHRDHVRFSQRELRERLALGRSQLCVHLRRLVEAELVRPFRASQGRGDVYALCFDGARDAVYDDEDPGVVRGGSGADPVQIRGVSGTEDPVRTGGLPTDFAGSSSSAGGVRSIARSSTENVHVDRDRDGGPR